MFDQFRRVARFAPRGASVLLVLGAGALTTAAGLAVWTAAALPAATAAADPEPPPRPANGDYRAYQSELSAHAARARQAADAADQRKAAAELRRVGTAQVCGITAGVGLALAGLGLIVAARPAAPADPPPTPSQVERPATATNTGDSPGRADAAPVTPGWSELVTPTLPGMLAMICGTVLVAYIAAEHRPAGPAPTATTGSPQPPSFGAYPVAPFVQPQAFVSPAAAAP